MGPEKLRKGEIAALVFVGAALTGGLAAGSYLRQESKVRTEEFQARLDSAAIADGFEGLELNSRASDTVLWHDVSLDIGACVLEARVSAGPDDDLAEDFTYIISSAEGVVSYEFNDGKQLTDQTGGENPCVFFMQNTPEDSNGAN